MVSDRFLNDPAGGSAPGIARQSCCYSYDPTTGNLIVITAPDGTVSFTYDGNCWSETWATVSAHQPHLRQRLPWRRRAELITPSTELRRTACSAAGASVSATANWLVSGALGPVTDNARTTAGELTTAAPRKRSPDRIQHTAMRWGDSLKRLKTPRQHPDYNYDLADASRT
jgi:hypothetical protein